MLPCIIETDEGLFIDGYKLPFVIENSTRYEDGVLTLSLACDHYRYEGTSHRSQKQSERTAENYSFTK